MYNVSPETKSAILSGARQNVFIQINSRTLTNAEIIAGSLSINRYVSSGNRLEIGSTISAELKFSVLSGNYSAGDFEGNWAYVYVMVNEEIIPLGYFYIDTVTVQNGQFSIAGLDSMCLFDYKATATPPADGATVLTWLNWILEETDRTLSLSYSSNAVNLDYRIYGAGDISRYTYRELLSFLCEITGTVGFFTYSRALWLYTPYEDTRSSAVTLSKSIRFSSEISELPLTITGLDLIDGDNHYMAGTSDYALIIDNNPLITHDYVSVAEAIYESVEGLTYYPFSASVLSLPFVYPFDVVEFELYDGTTVRTVVTDITYKQNRNTEIGARGESQASAESAEIDSFTRRERSTLRAINERTVTNLEFSELIQGALGLFLQTVETESGKRYYFSNKENLEDSTYIIGLTSNGIGFASEWNGDDTEWSYGISDTSDAFFKWISANGITVSTVASEYSITITPSAFLLKWNDIIVAQLVVDTMEIPKLKVDSIEDIGAIRMVRRIENSTDIGIDFVFIGGDS